MAAGLNDTHYVENGTVTIWDDIKILGHCGLFVCTSMCAKWNKIKIVGCPILFIMRVTGFHPEIHLPPFRACPVPKQHFSITISLPPR